MNDPGSFWHNAAIVSAYSRAQAIDDDALVDLTRWAVACGIRLPLAITATARKAALCAPRADGKPSGIDVARFVAWLSDQMRLHAQDDLFVASFTRIDGKPIELKAICGPGDRGEPVLTVMLPTED